MSENDIDKKDIREKLKKQSYYNLAKKYGLLRILINWDSILAVIITMVVCKFYLFYEGFSVSVSSVILALIGADAGLLGIVLAGYAIIISLIQGKFAKFLHDFELFDDIIFLFTHSAIFVSIGLISSILLILFLPVHLLISKGLFIVSIGTTIYGILSIVLLLLTMKRYAFLRKNFSTIEEGYK